MSSVLLKERIMLNMDAEKNGGDNVFETNSEEIAKDCPHPIKKLFIGSDSTSDIFTGTRDNVDEANNKSASAGTVAGQMTQSDATDSTATPYQKSTNNEVRTKKVWMASGVMKREPRVGADYQALIE